LEPAERLSEVLFGLIMVISIISTVNLMLAGGETVGELLIAAIGCNTAWGIVDGVLYVLNNVMQRSRRNVIIQKIRQAKNPEEALAMIRHRLDPMITPLVENTEKDQFYRAIYKKISKAPLETGRLLKEDLLGAATSFILVFLSTFPVTIPFMVISDPKLALKISYLIGLIMLFLVGYRWGHFAMLKPMRPALGMVLIGVTLILITIALGG
jgi:VIT1/CCC1 family predicted Fe2+/Mn2+ transporter